MSQKIILATNSPYRKEAFGFLGIDFEAEGSNIEENFKGRPENPSLLVKELARLKAEAVAKNHTQGFIIGFDSIAYFQGQILEKPKSRQEGYTRLVSLSGQKYDFYTGLHIINIEQGGKIHCKRHSQVVKTEVQLRKLSTGEISRYLNQDPRFKTFAQGFDPLETYGSTFVKEIHGSHNNVLRGIPLEVIVELLPEEISEKLPGVK